MSKIRENSIRRVLFTLVFCMFPGPVFSQETVDLDGLFDEDSSFQDVPPGETTEDSLTPSVGDSDTSRTKTPEGTAKEGILDSVFQKQGPSLTGNFRFFAGYSHGWKELPWDAGSFADGSGMSLMGMSSSLTLDFIIGPEFRVLQKYGLSFPSLETSVTEFFCDYTPGENFYLRMGRQNLTWGISRNFHFTNLTARLPDNFGETGGSDSLTDADSYSLKAGIPIGKGGMEVLAFTRNGFLAAPSSPVADEIGYGATVNFADTLGDLTFGTFYHKDMNWRGYYSFSTTLFGSLEVYQEGLIAYDWRRVEQDPAEVDTPTPLDEYSRTGDPGDLLDFSLNIGAFYELFDRKLKLSGEYFYNGEETELEVKGSTFPLFWGQNLAVGAAWQEGKFRVFSQLKYNFNLSSGLLVSGVSWDPLPYLSLTASAPLILGSGSAGYGFENPDSLDRKFSFILTAALSGKG